MADWPSSFGDGQRTQVYGTTPATVTGVTVTSLSTVNTKTPIGTTPLTPITESTAFDAAGIYVSVANSGALIFLLDIAIGPALSEVVILPNLYWADNGTNRIGSEVYFPIAIPAGSRISARVQSNTVSVSMTVSVRIQGAGSRAAFPCSLVTPVGDVATASRGTILPLPTGNYFAGIGAWQALSKSVTGTPADLSPYPFEQVMLSIQPTSANQAIMRVIIDVGIGAGTPTTLLSVHAEMHANHDAYGTPWFGPIPCSIPAGSTISMRYQRGTNATTLHAILYGLN